ncbi:alpha/beta hydrolase [Bradyrhizobium altum]|uniref:alpha/beta hydrolase n=1 Tax=Bradyrhizobium altum TaxID=1571202 RepID=UPI002898DE17|nr:alpha/beta hydrolase [Bradyrhizobium altum]
MGRAIKPNIVLVHGAWGDASHWRHVIPRLHEKGYRVFAAQIPLTSLADDIDRTSKLVAAQDAPTLLVGHAYGCAVITGAGRAPNVVGLVYLAGPALDEGESLNDLLARRALPEGAANIRQDNYGFLWIAPEKFRETFCHDLDDETESLVWALTQKPTAERCFEEKSGPPAWKVKPSWYQISADDRLIPVETEKWMAQRIEARATISLQTSHASVATRPNEIVMLIEEASNAAAGKADHEVAGDLQRNDPDRYGEPGDQAG